MTNKQTNKEEKEKVIYYNYTKLKKEENKLKEEISQKEFLKDLSSLGIPIY
jgi:hypothetical protein